MYRLCITCQSSKNENFFFDQAILKAEREFQFSLFLIVCGLFGLRKYSGFPLTFPRLVMSHLLYLTHSWGTRSLIHSFLKISYANVNATNHVGI